MRESSTISYRISALLCAALMLALVACGGGDDGGGGGGGDDGGPGGGVADAAPQVSDLLIAFDRDGDLWVLDPVTGQGTEQLETSYNGDPRLGVVSSSIYMTDKDELWLGMGDDTDCPACLMTLNFSTGEATLLTDNIDELETGIPGLGRSPFGGFLFMAKGADRIFYGFNPDTALPQIINTMLPAEGRGAGMAFSDDNILYGALTNQLVTLDPLTGAATQVGFFSAVGFPDEQENFVINSMTYLDGTMYGLFRAFNKTTYLVTIDLTNATTTLIAQNPENMEGLATLPANKLP